MIIKAKDIKIKYWEVELEKILISIATLEFRLETLKGIPDDEEVGEKPLSQVIGGRQAMQKIKAKEVREDCEKELKQKENMKRALETLLNQ